MQIINVYLTNPLGAELESFEHDDLRVEFDTLDAGGPKRLIEGKMYAFIDWVLDDLAGLEMCRRLRADERCAHAHITMILENDNREDRSRALNAGADDYMLAPLDRTGVLDRVLALQSHRGLVGSNQITTGPFAIDMTALRAMYNGQTIDLRPNEFRLFRFFVENPNQVLSRQALINGIGKQEPPIDERTVDVWIGRLRRALKAAGAGDPLRTIRSLGYVFDAPDA